MMTNYFKCLLFQCFVLYPSLTNTTNQQSWMDDATYDVLTVHFKGQGG